MPLKRQLAANGTCRARTKAGRQCAALAVRRKNYCSLTVARNRATLVSNRSFLLILVFPLRGNDCLDRPRRELHSGRKPIAGVLRPIPVNDEERLLIGRPVLGLALSLSRTPISLVAGLADESRYRPSAQSAPSHPVRRSSSLASGQAGSWHPLP